MASAPAVVEVHIRVKPREIRQLQAAIAAVVDLRGEAGSELSFAIGQLAAVDIAKIRRKAKARSSGLEEPAENSNPEAEIGIAAPAAAPRGWLSIVYIEHPDDDPQHCEQCTIAESGPYFVSTPDTGRWLCLNHTELVRAISNEFGIPIQLDMRATIVAFEKTEGDSFIEPGAINADVRAPSPVCDNCRREMVPWDDDSTTCDDCALKLASPSPSWGGLTASEAMAGAAAAAAVIQASKISIAEDASNFEPPAPAPRAKTAISRDNPWQCPNCSQEKYSSESKKSHERFCPGGVCDWCNERFVDIGQHRPGCASKPAGGADCVHRYAFGPPEGMVVRGKCHHCGHEVEKPAEIMGRHTDGMGRR